MFFKDVCVLIVDYFINKVDKINYVKHNLSRFSRGSFVTRGQIQKSTYDLLNLS